MALRCCYRDPYRHTAQLQLSRKRAGMTQRDPAWLGDRSNRVVTAKYSNYLSWLVFSLLRQFYRAANIYFLFISILTFFSFSPKSPWSMVGTFSAVLIFSMLKDLYEDHGRKREDGEKNRKNKAVVFSEETQTFQLVSWEDIRVGDLVHLREGQEVPADLLLLYSEDADFHVYADTKNLDGQTNSKQYSAVFQDSVDTESFVAVCRQLEFDKIQYERPSEKLDEWRGSIDGSPVGSSNLLMRGSMVRKYESVGLAVYVGPDTRIMKNAKEPPHKISNMIRLMNWMMLSVFCLQLALVAWLSVRSEGHVSPYYIEGDKYGSNSFLVSVLVFWVAYSHMIPISLYVIVEVLKIVQKFLIQWDDQLIDQNQLRAFRKATYGNSTVFDPEKNIDAEPVRALKEKLRARVRNSDLVEELGQITHIFSDKTGTLTKNELKYIKSWCGGREFAAESKPANQFLVLNMLLNHGIETENGQNYVGKSSDEVALLEAARDLWKMKFCRQQNTAHGRIKSVEFDSGQKSAEIFEFRVLHTLEFDSARKRMAVLCQREEEKDYVLFVKGADTALQFAKRELSIEKAKDYAAEGLRTLAFGHRLLSQTQYDKDFLPQIQRLADDQASFDTKQTILEDLERGLVFDGVVGIEDRLQDGVQTTLKNLSETNIKIWVLTGDKLETAREIGSSCGILNDSVIVELSLDNCRLASEVLEFRGKLQGLFTNEPKWQKEYLGMRLGGIDRERPYSIIIDHCMLCHVLQDLNMQERFFQIAVHAKTVLCCRSSPKQKSQVIRTSKRYLRKNITLAIGDGANDVPMIKEAHVGVAIRGKEGLEAHSASDYSITQFRFLERLLLVHGRLAYRRVAWMICYYFYKNLVLVATELFFARAAGYSGQIFFADWLPQLYNSLWTSWPCLFSFIFDKDDPLLFDRELGHKRFRAQALKNAKKLYSFGQRRGYFNFAIFWKWTLLAFLHGCVCYWVPVLTLSGPAHQSGLSNEHWYVSTVSFTCCVFMVTLKLFLETVYWNWFNLLIGVVSVIIYFVVLSVGSLGSVSVLFNPELVGVVCRMLTDVQAVVSFMMGPLVVLTLDGSLLMLQYTYCYRAVNERIQTKELVKEMQKQVDADLVQPETERKLVARGSGSARGGGGGETTAR